MRLKLADQSAVGILDSLIARLVLENQLARIVDPASRVMAWPSLAVEHRTN